jgi:hypothetical protein
MFRNKLFEFFCELFAFHTNSDTVPFWRLKGIVQPFELGGETRLIRSAVKY